MSIVKKEIYFNLTLDLVPIISYNYISASFEDLSLSKTINLNGTCTGKSKYGDPRSIGQRDADFSYGADP